MCKNLAWKLLNALQSRVNGPDGKSRDYVLQAVDLPDIGIATMTYLLASRFASTRSYTMDNYKNTFNVFCLLPPPANKAYEEHILACNKNTADDILGQSDKNAAPIKRTPFINGRQEKMEDVLATIGNLFIFFKCIVQFDINNEETYPFFLRRLSSLASTITDPRFRHLVDSSLPIAPWIPHQIIFFVQNYFQTFTQNAMNPTLLRNVLTKENENKYNIKDFRQSEFMFRSFHDKLLRAMNCNNLGLLTSPPQTYFYFFPDAKPTTNKNFKSADNKNYDKGDGNNQTRQLVQILVTGRQPVVPPHSKLSFKPCSDFLQGKCSKPSTGPNKCQFTHCLFPRDYNKSDRVEMCRWIDGASHIEWADGPKQAMDKMKASNQF